MRQLATAQTSISNRGRASLSSQVAALFAKYNELGVRTYWMDLSDKATLWQDAAGTTPVTATGQPIGRIADKAGSANYAVQATATSRPQYTESGSLAYGLLDGVDDSWQTVGNLDLSGTSRATVVAGAKKLSDANVGMLWELGPTYTANTGTFNFYAPLSAAPNYGMGVNGGLASAFRTATGYPAGTSNVLAALYDTSQPVSNDKLQMRVNGTPPASFTPATDAGTANLSGAYPLNIGRRNNATFPFNGQLGQFLLIGTTILPAELALLEAFAASKMGVTL